MRAMDGRQNPNSDRILIGNAKGKTLKGLGLSVVFHTLLLAAVLTTSYKTLVPAGAVSDVDVFEDTTPVETKSADPKRPELTAKLPPKELKASPKPIPET